MRKKNLFQKKQFYKKKHDEKKIVVSSKNLKPKKLISTELNTFLNAYVAL